MRITLKNINAALKIKGYSDELVKGNGYFYFSGDKSANWHTSSVPTMHLNAMTVEEWIEQYELMMNEHNHKKGE